MRKILLATTALIAFAGAAQAAESPIQVTVGGNVDFRAAAFHESDKTATGRRTSDFETEYTLNFAAEGKMNGVEYGSMISLSNSVDFGQNTSTNSNTLAMKQAYVWMSGAFGKVLMGDERGASDLFVSAPTVGEGQIFGSYTNFTDVATLAAFSPVYIDATENNTKITYYTPKVGNANHKVQLGVSFSPNDEQGVTVSKYVAASGYKNQVEAAAQYTGSFSPVTVAVSPMLAVGEGERNATTTENRDYTVWGVGAQATYAGVTVGGSYVDAGRLSTASTQNKDQDVWTLGAKYEFDKVALAANYMDGEGYYNVNGVAGNEYVKSFQAYGLGATYTWFPGLTTAADAVFFHQSADGATASNEGHVLMLSQKMTF